MTLSAELDTNSRPPLSSSAASAPGTLRILQVVEPGMDGAFQVVNILVRNLLAAGYEVALAYSDRRAGKALADLLEAVRQRGGECLNLRVGNSPEPGDFRALRQLWGLARRFRPDVIHAHSSKAGALVRMLPFLNIRSRFFYTPHAYYGLSGRRGARAHLFNTIERMLGGIGRTFATSQGELDFAHQTLRVSPDRTVLTNNPVDAGRFHPIADRTHIRELLGIPLDAQVIGWVGRLSFQKDPQTCYRALAPLLQSNPRLRFLQIGRGELDEELRTLGQTLGIEDRIVRHEHFSEPWLAYQAMDGLIMTSRYEGLSLVMLEALASNIPLILSQTQGVSDLAPERLSHCWIAPIGDVAAFSAALKKWLDDQGVSRPCNHREEAIGRFGIEQWLATHLAAYRR